MRLLALCAACLIALPASAELVDGVAAIVDDEVILRSDVELAAGSVLRRLQEQHGSVPPDVQQEVRAQALQALIDQQLIEDVAERMGIAASETDVDGAIEAIARQEGVTAETIYEAVETQGLGRARYRDQLASEITRMKVVSSAVRSRVSVSEEDVRELFEKRYRGQAGLQAHARHILLPWPSEEEATREEVVALATRLHQKVLDGSEFSSVARRYSRAPSAVDGGMTVFREGEVAPELRVVFNLEPGELSPVIETRHGLNLLQLV
ncbi:MAG: peptidylprolyl isomerase, partial [Myxococcota bacterium]